MKKTFIWRPRRELMVIVRRDDRASEVGPQRFHVKHHNILPDLELQLDRSEVFSSFLHWLLDGVVEYCSTTDGAPSRTRR